MRTIAGGEVDLLASRDHGNTLSIVLPQTSVAFLQGRRDGNLGYKVAKATGSDA